MRASVALTSLAAVAVTAAAASLGNTCEYCSQGPCIPITSINSAIDAQDSTGKKTRLGLRVTVPAPKVHPPYPLIFLFNGFQARSSYYQMYAERLATFGYVVVQYNLPLFRVIPDATEMQFLDSLLTWLREQNQSEDSRLHGLLDLERIAVAGHSRGAKLAALQYAGRSDVKAAYLIDPVDNTKFTPESSQYPSAVKALQRSGKPVGLTGAGVVGSCNPKGSNFQEFYGAAAGRSWLTLVKQSSHTEFLNAGPILNKAIAAFCGAVGGNSYQETFRLTAPPLLAWMESHLHADDPAAQARMRSFFQFMDLEEAAGNVDFHIKPGATRSTEEQPNPMHVQGSMAAHRMASRLESLDEGELDVQPADNTA